MGVESTQLISTRLLSLKMRYSAFLGTMHLITFKKHQTSQTKFVVFSIFQNYFFPKVTFKYGCLKLAFMMDSYATRDERKKINISLVPPTPTPHSSQSGKGGCLKEKGPTCSDLSLFGQK